MLSVTQFIIRNKCTGHARIRMSRIISFWGWQHYFAELAQFLTHTIRNLGLVAADENDQPSRGRSDHARGRKHAV